MPRDNQGNHSLPPGTLVNSGDTILPAQHNPAMQDISQSLGNSLSRDGTGGMRAPLDHGGFKAVNMAAGTDPTDGARMDQISGAGFPVGMPGFWFTDTPPSGWLLAYGQAVSRTEFSALFEVFGTRFGVGDGSTTFNMPDCRGITFVGRDNMGGAAKDILPSATAIGAIIGSATVALSLAQMPAHSHTGTTASNGAHSHDLHVGNGFEGQWQYADTGSQQSGGFQGGYIGSAGAHAHSFTTNNAGSGQAHANVQPSFPCNVIIKARGF